MGQSGGIPRQIGELWNLARLTLDCRPTGRRHSLRTVKALDLTGEVGLPVTLGERGGRGIGYVGIRLPLDLRFPRSPRL